MDPERYPEIVEKVIARGNTPAGGHVPIMVEEVVGGLEVAAGDFVVDGTLGHGGHAERLLEANGPAGRLLGLDCDGGELERTRKRLERFGERLVTRRSSYAGLGRILAEVEPEGAAAVLVDCGVSSMQLDQPDRGFSFKRAGPLDMRMDDRRKRSAADWLRTIGVAELAKALRELADEPDAEVIAERIVAERELKPIESTLDLARLVCRAKGLPERVPDDGPKAHPAARSFQALRMLVNDERSQLEELLRQLPYCLRPGGRAAFLTFHSGEENLVRKAVAEGRRAGLYAEGPSEPLKPDAAERRRNPRSAPARLHLFRRRAD